MQVNYNTDYECMYMSEDIFLETDMIGDHDKIFIVNCIYRNDILYIFNIEDFDIEIINNSIEELYKQIILNEDLKYCIEKICEKYLNDNLVACLEILFSFDYLYLAHPCICEFIKTGKISEQNIIKLKEKILG